MAEDHTHKKAFLRFLAAMQRLSTEVNDTEICKRFETLMFTNKDDLNLQLITQLLANPRDFDPNVIQEPFGQYVRHFLYMIKRSEKQGVKWKEILQEINEDNSILKSVTNKKRSK
jgi:hypothetical protein